MVNRDIVLIMMYINKLVYRCSYKRGFCLNFGVYNTLYNVKYLYQRRVISEIKAAETRIRQKDHKKILERKYFFLIFFNYLMLKYDSTMMLIAATSDDMNTYCL